MDPHEFRSEMPAAAPEAPAKGVQAAQRKFVDCRSVPSEKHCSLFLAGTEQEVMQAAREHAISYHGEQAGPELDRMIRESMRDVPADSIA